jgi:CHASE2 domain-containing sensor protein
VWEEDPVRSDRDLWPAVRWPLVVLAVAVVGIVVAAVLDRTAAREWALTIGGPSLTAFVISFILAGMYLGRPWRPVRPDPPDRPPSVVRRRSPSRS